MRRSRLGPAAAMLGIAALTAIQLHRQGRRWWCACGSLAPWSGDIWSRHNSQHLLDPYAITHVPHGVLLCGLLALIVPRLGVGWRLAAAVALEAIWEVSENTEAVIRRYREATIALDYFGDSVANSLADILACAFGFVAAHRLGFWKSVALFAACELLTLWWIKDGLILNVVMLVHPIAALKAWQMGR